jgi:hypothetical protein
MYVYYQADYDIELWVILSQLANTDPDIVQWSAFRKEYHFWMLIIWGTLAAASVNWSGPVWVGYIPQRATDSLPSSISALIIMIP